MNECPSIRVGEVEIRCELPVGHAGAHQGQGRVTCAGPWIDPDADDVPSHDFGVEW